MAKKIDWTKHRFAYKEKTTLEMFKQEEAAQERMAQWSGNGVKITFGKYKGTSIKKLDTGYLRWLVKNVKTDSNNLIIKAQLAQAKQEYVKRIKYKMSKIHSRPKVGGPVYNSTVEKVTNNNTRDISSESLKVIG
jgi:hypothetical protein